ncbi:hypothetical protein FSP39_007704 [Pinctada imbricata]|uniref:acetate--CoA ligase n=1 Tax=Pinctada imbricata TaxID=66713 RepID=A0AA89C351_PINIB|nr:hypothetical protein FSP39_007704 [Pinctada imbricata]
MQRTHRSNEGSFTFLRLSETGDPRFIVPSERLGWVNCVDRHLDKLGDSPALIWEKDEPGTEEYVTYRELYKMVNQMANMLRAHGVGRGDRVAIYLPTSPIAVAAMLACARIGAIHSVVFAGFSAEALADRIIDANAATVITSDEGVRGGKTIPLKQVVDTAVSKCPCVKRVFVYERTGNKEVRMGKLDVSIEKHFKDGKLPTDEFPDPEPADPLMAKQRQKRKAPKERGPLPKKTKISKVPASSTEMQSQSSGVLDDMSLQENVVTHTAGPTTNDNNLAAEQNIHIHQDDENEQTELKCFQCGTDLFRNKKFVKKLRRKSFICEVKSTDASCFRYTGVPNRKTLIGIFEWVKEPAKKIKLWDGKRTYEPKRKQGRRRYTPLNVHVRYYVSIDKIAADC